MKRFFDIAAAILLIFIFFPILAITAMAIYLQDRGEILFCQRRVGLDGKEFFIFKFRSMVSNAEDIGYYYTKDGDHRITPVGHVIRRTSLDELPQLFNVLKGDMSLVGPRPDLPLQSEFYTNEEWKLRNSVRPGITGLAQAKIRSWGTMEERKRLDLYYVKNMNFWLDLKIIIITLKQVLFTGGN